MVSFMPGNINVVNLAIRVGNQAGGKLNTQQMHVNALQVGNQGYWRFKKPNLVCIFCGMNGYTIDRCYKKHGNSPGFEFRNKPPGTQVSISQSIVDNGSNSHNYRFMEIDAQAYNNCVNKDVVDSHVAAPVITQAQYSHLLTLLQQDITGANAGDKGVEHIAGQATFLQANFKASRSLR